jgi:hypothetical protein
MTPDELPFGNITLVEVVSEEDELDEAFSAGAEVRLTKDRRAMARLTLPSRNLRALVRARDGRRSRRLGELADSLWPRIVVVVRRTGNELLLRIHEFTQVQSFVGETITFGFDAGTAEAMRQHGTGSAEEAGGALQEALALDSVAQGQPYRLFGVVEAADARGDRLRLHGPRLTADVRRVTSDGGAAPEVAPGAGDTGERLMVTAVATRSALNGQLVMFEIDAVAFVPAEATQPLSIVSRGMFLRLFAGTQRYLSLWTRYSELDKERLDAEAQAIGSFSYASVEKFGRRWRFALSGVDPDALSGLREAAANDPDFVLEAAASRPSYLIGDRYDDEDAPPPPHRGGRGSRRSATRAATGRCRPNGIDAAGEWIEVDGDSNSEEPPRQGYVFLSQRGSRTAQRRRERARDGIREGRCPMPQLALILEDQPLPGRPVVSDDHHLTPAVRAQFGPQGPTPLQLRALKIAVETPDIALIQGPPGTGKTQVIAAIVKRLEELADPTENPVGLFLLTSHQHVAVREMAGRIEPFGLPPIKSGKGHDAKNAGQTGSETTERWRTRLVEHLHEAKAAFLHESKLAAYGQLKRRHQAYIRGHHRLDETVRMLEETADLAADLVSVERCLKLRQMAAMLLGRGIDGDEAARSRRDNAYRATYALRYQATAFADDGPLTARKLLTALAALSENGVVVSAEAMALLEQIGNGPATATPERLGEIGRLREELLQKFAPDKRPLSARAAPLERVSALLRKTVQEARERLTGSQAGLGLLLDDYESEVVRNPWRADEALTRYSAARAETCQGSAGTLDAALARRIGERGFETVIIDEAARANPLDLLIPMAQARRRIILVGDQKQLPHTLESKLEAVVDATFEEAERAALRESLFEKLFNDLRRREDAEHVSRTVTLDTQFRMHELLGKFVSDQFYPGELTSPPDWAARFAHGLPAYRRGSADVPAAWIDVPARVGGGRRRDLEDGGRSKSRRVEVSAIRAAVGEIFREEAAVARLFKDKETDRIGIISFYADQATLLRQQLAHYEDRVEIGTVDAFQGKQFPVVFLSMTRSNERTYPALQPGMSDREAELENDKWARGRYGHLMLANRMCVALSRQRNLLIVVGDRRMLRYPDAGAKIGPLVAFEQLCRAAGVLREWDGSQLRDVPLAAAAAE